MSALDTIVAIATPAGAGAVSVLRLSGAEAGRVAAAIAGPTPSPRHAALRRFVAADGALIDRGLMLYFPAPASFTGEDVVELQAHGSPVVMEMLLQSALTAGARRARPGEFSERAFLNGRLDLTQAEAIADLINAGSAAAARAAARSLEGQFAQALSGLREKLTECRCLSEAAIDFAEEAIPELGPEALRARLDTLSSELDGIRRAAEQGHALGRGQHVVIVGRPNVGKSSLLNRLARREHAIVSAEPGTTRDALQADIRLGQLSLTLVDTAGQRETECAVEREGVRRARQALAQADHLLLVTDASRPLDNADLTCAQGVAEGTLLTVVRNKLDLCGRPPGCWEEQGLVCIGMSAATGAGLEALVQRLQQAPSGESAGELTAYAARARHLEALARAARELEAATTEWDEGVQELELLAERLRLADRALGAVSGETDTEALLGRIFADFCIGK